VGKQAGIRIPQFNVLALRQKAIGYSAPGTKRYITLVGDSSGENKYAGG
jgi:hypothetical protein